MGKTRTVHGTNNEAAGRPQRIVENSTERLVTEEVKVVKVPPTPERKAELLDQAVAKHRVLAVAKGEQKAANDSVKSLRDDLEDFLAGLDSGTAAPEMVVVTRDYVIGIVRTETMDGTILEERAMEAEDRQRPLWAADGEEAWSEDGDEERPARRLLEAAEDAEPEADAEPVEEEA